MVAALLVVQEAAEGFRNWEEGALDGCVQGVVRGCEGRGLTIGVELLVVPDARGLVRGGF